MVGSQVVVVVVAVKMSRISQIGVPIDGSIDTNVALNAMPIDPLHTGAGALKRKQERQTPNSTLSENKND